MRYSSWIHREVSEKDAKDYADSIHAIFVETSAKNAININEVFIEISESVFLNVWHLWLLVCIRVHQMTQLSNIFQHLRYATEEKAHYGWIPGHVREMRPGLYIFCHQTYFSWARVSSSAFCCQSSRDPLRYAEAEAAFSSTKDALLASMKWCCCYLSD